jgi:hypothetical protein
MTERDISFHNVYINSQVMVEHIEKTQLYSDLRYRFDYVSKFLSFTQDDIAMLNSFASIVFPRIPVIADKVYRKLFSFDITKKHFITQNSAGENVCPNPIVNSVSDAAEITYRKDMLSIYLKRVLTQREWDDTFLQYLSQIGKMHTNQIGSSSINVDYMHINALLGFLEHLLIDLLWKDENIEDKNKHSMVMAINKLFWIQNDFFTMHYLMPTKEDLPSSNIIIKTESDSCCKIQ